MFEEKFKEKKKGKIGNIEYLIDAYSTILLYIDLRN
jgi:hypothetical protein